jgi:hypothetical protein
MNATATRNRMSWSARLLIALTLILAGSAAAVWALARYDRAAVLLGVAPEAKPAVEPQALRSPPVAAPVAAPAADAVAAQRIAELELRLARVEQATNRAEGSAGRADALVVAFAARRAIDRGNQLGFLEPLLVDRFGRQHPRAVATIITAARNPVRLDQLIEEFDQIEPDLRSGGPEEGLWAGIKRELGSMIEIRRADQAPADTDSRFRRARERLRSGDVDTALAEVMRLPGAANAPQWIARARRYVTAHQALDEVEASALMTRTGTGAQPG